MASNAPVAVELFSTSILSNHKVRSRHERFLSVLQVKKIPFVYHDLASDDEAKSRWRRKAKDAQLPGLLVHNEWRGTFEEFEEAVELGELDLFLNIDAQRAQEEADSGIIPQPLVHTLNISASQAEASSSSAIGQASTRKPSKHHVATVPRLAQPRQASQTNLAPALPIAAPRSFEKKSSGNDTESFLRSIGVSELSLSEAELSEVLEAGQSAANSRNSSKSSHNSSQNAQADRGEGRYPDSLGIGSSSQKAAIPRTYIPSADAGTKPLRLAKMGNGTAPSARAGSTPHARYNASLQSSRALAAEAQATASSRSFSTIRLRDAVKQGNDLQSAMSQTRLASSTDKAEQIVGREDIDELMASLGLDDVKMSEEEAEAFLFDGVIPKGMGGADDARLGRAASAGDRARNESAARSVAERAREKISSGSRRGSAQEESIVDHDLGVTPAPVAVQDFKRSSTPIASMSEVSNKPATPTSEVKDDTDELIEAPVHKELAAPQMGLKEALDATKENQTPRQKTVEIFDDLSLQETVSPSRDVSQDKSSVVLEAARNVSRPDDEKSDASRSSKPAPTTPRKSQSLLTRASASPAEAVSPTQIPLPVSTQTSPAAAASQQSTIISQTSALDFDRSLTAAATQSQTEGKVVFTPSQSAGSQTPSTVIRASSLTSPQTTTSQLVSEERKATDGASPTSEEGDRRKIASKSTMRTSQTSRGPTLSPNSNRRRAIDVSRANVPHGSPNQTLSPIGSSPGESSTAMGPRSPSGDGASPLSPKSEKRRLFTLGRRKSKDRRESQGDKDDDDDIPSTIDPNLLESRSSLAFNGPRGPIDRSQKTLSVILREADEALSGIDGDEDLGSGRGAGNSDDEKLGSFDFDIDLEGSRDDGMSVERSK